MISGYVTIMGLLAFLVVFNTDEVDEFSTLEKISLLLFWPVSVFMCFLIASKKMREKLTDKKTNLLDK